MQTLRTSLFTAILLATAVAAGAQEKKDTVKQLKAVDVTATRPPITMQGGTMVMNVGQTATAAGSNAWEVLQKAPGVVVDNTNNVQLNGKAVTVYIDGRPSRLTGDDLKNLLASTPGGNIDKIELMSNPSTKYDAQGATIINIKMLKPKDLGTNGTLTLSGGFGRYPRTTEGFTLNHRSKGVSLYGGYDHMYSKQFTSTVTDRRFPGGYLLTDNDYNRENRHSHNLKAGADFDITKNTSAGVLVKGMFSSRGRNGDNLTSLADSNFVQLANGNLSVVNPSVNAWFKTGNAKKKNELSINADYFSYHKDWNDAFAGQYYSKGGQTIGDESHLRNESDSRINLYSFSADYTQELPFAKLEAGIKTTFTETDNELNWENRNSGKWENDPGKSNHFIYKENVNAAYLGLSKTVKKYTFNAVLRAEHTNAKGNSLTMDQRFTRDYVQLFPSASVSYMKDMQNQFSLSYRRSINRFGFEIVNPFITYRSAYSYMQGNPDIKPMTMQSVEARWSHKYQLFTTLAFTRIKDNLSVVVRQDPDTKILVQSFENQSNMNVGSATVVWSKPVTPKFRTTLTAVGLYLHINTLLDGVEYKKDNLTAILNMQNSYTLPKGFTAELSGAFQSPVAMGYASLRSMGYVDLGLKKTIMKGNGSLKLGVNDVFNTRRFRFDVLYGNVNNQSEHNMDTRVVNLTFNYRFGNKNVKQTKARKNAIEAEAGRTNTTTM
ncbi:outer membrane beta-barrel family protein [Chitinophaga sp.]|uniref:outer membrane beta-barrel family protein n=1 Tax=Chitinophaga sp. TaxID=1869181 RepID=UPI0031DBF8C8